MGQRGELFSTRVMLPNRTYFFNVKENRMGDLYLNIVESKNRDAGGFDRQSVILFADDLQEFLKGFDESLRVLEREMRERRRPAKTERGGTGNDKGGRSERQERHHKTGGKKGGHEEKPRRDRPLKDSRRVVVKKRNKE